MYALCLDYKTEQAHIDYILRTREAAAVKRRGDRLAMTGEFNDWRIALGGVGHLGRGGVIAAVVVAALAIALSALSLIEERRGRWWLLLLLRAAGRSPAVALVAAPGARDRAARQIIRVANHVAVLVDVLSRIDGGASARRRLLRGMERAAALVRRAAPRLRRLGDEAGHRVDLYSFYVARCWRRRRPIRWRRGRPAEATSIGEALAECARALRGPRPPGELVMISDGIYTGRIGEGPIDPTTRNTVQSLATQIHTVGDR